jgi:hypothetical protein
MAKMVVDASAVARAVAARFVVIGLFFSLNWLRAVKGDQSSGNLTGYDSRPVGNFDSQQGVPREVILARTATGPLTRNNRAPLENLSTPDTPRLGPLDGACQALDLERATPAKGLRNLQVSRHIGEPQIRVVLAAR